jgi:hypothetical protein
MTNQLDSIRRLALAMTAAVLATACGGGVDSGGTGITSQTLAVGPVSGFGSILVNGVHYTDESAARISDEDEVPLEASALKLGSMVTVEGSRVTDNGQRLESRALSIRVTTLLVGPVDSVDAAAGTLRVLGQTVETTPGTHFDGALVGGLAALRAGDIVAVSGQFDRSLPRAVATRVEPRPGATTYVLTGIATSLDIAAQSMIAGGLHVDLGALATPSDAASVAVGDVVRLRLRTTLVGGAWMATALRGTALDLGTREFVEIEGRISRYGSAAFFEVDGIPVDATAASFPSGSTGLRKGARVEITGRSTDSTVIARTVKLESDEDAGDAALELEGRITAVDLAARTFVLRGATVAYDDSTRFEGGLASDLRVGRMAAAKGILSADGTRVNATSVHVEM